MSPAGRPADDRALDLGGHGLLDPEQRAQDRGVRECFRQPLDQAALAPRQ